MKDTNSLWDEVRVQHRKMQGKPLKEQLDYYWNYYKVQTIVLVVAACMLGSLIHTIVTSKETVLSVAYINAFPNVEDEIFMTDFGTWLGISPEKQQVTLDSSYYITEDSSSQYALSYEQKFLTNISAGTLDVVLADEEYFAHYGRSGMFADLRTVMTAEELAAYEDRLFYCDFTNDESDEEIPVGIDISQTSKILSTASYPNVTAYYGIVFDTKHADAALSYLEYLELE